MAHARRWRILAAPLLAAALHAAPLSAQQAFTIDTGHSYIGFRVRHLMISTIRGHFASFAGRIALDTADTRRSSVEVTIAAASVESGNERRDRDVRGASFLASERFQEITFRSRRIERAPDGWRAIGDLTIRGVTNPVVIPFSLGVAPGGHRMGVTASLTIDREDYGMTGIPAATVGREVTIEIDVEAAPSGER